MLLQLILFLEEFIWSLFSSFRKASYGSDSGVIASPFWPGYYHSAGYECEWDIKTSSSKLIQLNIMDLDMYSTCSSDYLEIKGKFHSYHQGCVWWRKVSWRSVSYSFVNIWCKLWHVKVNFCKCSKTFAF